MPQITLKYSSNITGFEFVYIFQKIHHILSEITDIKTCKSNAQELKNFYIGISETFSQPQIRRRLASQAKRSSKFRVLAN